MSLFDDDDEEVGQWTLARIYADLGGKTDITKTLGISMHRLDHWLKRSRARDIIIPYPVKRIAHIDVYSMQEWRDWFARWDAEHRPEHGYQRLRKNNPGETVWYR